MRSKLIAAALALVSAVPLYASIRGTVMSRTGQPVAGANVSAYSVESSDVRNARLVSATPGRAALASSTTDSKGVFVLDSPKDPVVAIEIAASGYAPAALRVVRDEPAAVVALASAPSKQGSVTAAGKPVGGATVIWSNGDAEIVTKTDPSGHYQVPEPSWASEVFVVHPDFALLEESFGPQRKPALNLALDAGVSISGRVVKGTAVVAKAPVLIDGIPLAVTGDDGSFSIAHAARNWQSIEARSAELAAFRARSAGGVMTLKLSAPTTIGGFVRDSKTQQPVAGAEVAFGEQFGRRMRLNALRAPNWTFTDDKGNFTIAIEPGTYQITGVHPAYSISTLNVALGAGQRVSKAVAAAPLAQISGSVVDESRTPVAAAIVTAQVVDRGRPFRMQRPTTGANTTVSAPDGRFTLRTADHGEVELNALKKGLPEATSNALRIAPGEKKDGITLTIARGVALTGRVLDRNGKPVAGAAVNTSEDDGAGAAGGGRPGAMVRRLVFAVQSANNTDAILTGSDGTFSVRVKPGTYDVRVSREGYAPKIVREEVSASSKPVAITLDPGIEISGRVTRGGNPVEGVNVRVADPNGLAAGVTGSDGSFVVPDLAPGSYMVIFTKPDEFIQQMRNVSAPAHNVNLDLPPGGRITGRVVDKSTHDPVTAFQAGIGQSRSGGGMIQGGSQLRSFTADDGTFTLDNVPTGPTQLVVSAAGYVTAHVPNLSVEEGKTVADVEVDLETGVRLTGRVTGPDGSPLPGVSVRPASNAGPMRIPGMGGGPVAVTDADGEYTLDSLEAGDNKAFEFLATGLLPAEKTVNLSGHETRLDMQLSGGLTVSGQVVSDAGVPISDADVRAVSAASGSTPKSTRTDASGTFVLDAMAPGHYTFNASRQGYTDGQLTDFDITSGAPPRVVLKSGATLFGHIGGVSDSDLSKVTVTARSATGSAEAVVDASGSYRMDGAPTGTLRVSATLMRGFGDARSTDVKSVSLDPGGSAQLDLQFTTDTTIRGHVSRNGAPASNSTVIFSPRSGGAQSRASAPTDDSGNYTLTGISDGDYGVTVVDMQRLNPYSTSYSVHGSGTFDIDIRTSSLRGQVIDRGDSSPIGGARIQLRGKDSQNALSNVMASSDDSGGFLIDGVAPGSYTITAEKDGYGNVVKDISFTENAPQDVMLDLARNDGLTLHVVDGRDGTTLNPNVAIYDGQNREVYRSARFGFGGGSDSERIPLAAGQYRAVIGANGYAAKTVSVMSPSSQTISLTPGGSLLLHSKAATPRRVLLIDASGSPYMRPNAGDPTIVLPIGDTRLPNIAGGQYTLQVVGPNGAVASSQPVVVVDGQEIAIDVP